MEKFVIKYKVLLSVFFGTFFLVAANYAPALSLFLLTDKEISYTMNNFIFLALGIIFLWGRIVSLANVITQSIKNKFNK